MTKLVSVDATPNPDSMKLNLDEPLGVSGSFTQENPAAAPELIQQVLGVDGVKSVFTAANFMTLSRDPQVAWPPIMEAVQGVFASASQ